MSQTIITRNIGGVDDKRLKMTTGQGKRLLAYLTSWTTVRIGVHWAIDPTAGAANITGTPTFFVGLCKNTANGYADVTTDHAYGFKHVGASMTYNANAGNPYYTTGNCVWTKRVGTTITNSSNVGGPMITANNTARRSVMIIEITKAAPNFSAQAIFPTLNTQGGIATDITPLQFEDMMNAASLTAAGALQSWNAPGAATLLAVDETTNGQMNALNIFWDKTAYPLEFCTVRHRKIA